MIVLALETSTACGSVAVVRTPGGVVCHESFHTDRSHNALLFGPLGRALAALAPGKPDLVVAGTGPGSYTGTRIGLAAAHGVAVVLGIPWAGWPSVTALADAPVYAAAGDARRGSVWLALVQGGRLVRGPELLAVAGLAARLEAGGPPVLTPDAKPLDPAIGQAVPDAARLALAFLRQDDKTRAAAARAPVEPIYLRAPYITTPAR